MKILLDPQIFNQQTYGGISRYYTEIFKVLKKKQELEIVLPLYHTSNFYLKDTDLLFKNKGLTFLYNTLTSLGISTKTLRRKKANQLLKKISTENKFDVFVPTYYNPYFLDIINNKPFVLTIYDMIHEIFPQYFVDDPYNVKVNKEKLIGKAARIIAVSHNTKKDILKIYPEINPEKIVVIHHGNSIKIDQNVKVDLPKNYLLFVGSRADYKNFKFLVNSIQNILKDNPDLTLIAAGGGHFNDEEINFIESLGLENQVVQKDFKENELGHYYKNAQCFIFPSLYEGFGIPVLESMACGCPIILSNSSSFPEVAEEAGIFFESNSEKDLQEKVNMILSNKTIREEYIKKGLEQVKKFDWNIAAEECLKVYKDAVKDNADQ